MQPHSHNSAQIETSSVEDRSESIEHSELDLSVYLRVSPISLLFVPENREYVLLSKRLIDVVQNALVLYARSAFSEGFHKSLPHLVDVCLMPPILDIFHYAEPSTKVFDLVYSLLDHLIGQWISDARAQLMRELTASVLPEPGSTTLVAFTFLLCDRCTAVRTFHSALFHDCSNRQYDIWHESLHDMMSSDLSILKHLVQLQIGRRPWDARTFHLRPASLACVQNLITAVNKGNIETATSVEFDKLDPRLVCRLCTLKSENSVKLAMPWRSALYHCLRAHYDHATRDVTWISLRKEHITDFENPVLQSRISSRNYDLESKWACVFCCPYDRPHEFDFDKRQVITHLLRVHDISKPILSQDFYRLSDSDPYLVHPCCLD